MPETGDFMCLGKLKIKVMGLEQFIPARKDVVFSGHPDVDMS